MKRSIKNDVLVIGSGIGGLSTASYLSKKGCNVLVLERLNQAGGFVHTFTRHNWTFEASTHLISGFSDNYLNQTLKILGLDLTIVPHQYAMESIFFKDSRIHKRYLLPSGERKALQSLVKYFPGDEKGIRNTFSIVKGIAEETLRLKSLQRSFKPNQISDIMHAFFFKHGNPGGLIHRLGCRAFPNLVAYQNKTVSEFLHDINHPDLRELYSLFSAIFGGRPSTSSALVVALVIYFLLLNRAYSIKGGTSMLIEQLLHTIYSNGGAIRFAANVKKIIVENGRAVGLTLDNGEELRAKYIVSNASAIETFTKLVGDGDFTFPNNFVTKLQRYNSSPSAFQVYVGLPFNIDDYGFHSALSSFTEGENLDKELSADGCPSSQSFFWLTNYGTTNPEFYTRGKTGLVIAEVDNIRRWRGLDKKSYKNQKTATQHIIIDKVRRITDIPIERAEVVFSGTPLTMARYSGDPMGGIVGADCSVEQSGMNRFDYVTPLPGLFLVGSDSIPSGGISACLDSGVLASRRLLKS